MPITKPTRRAILSSTIAAVPAAMLASCTMAQSTSAGDGSFEYEVTRTESEWRALLTDVEYKILREGATEAPKSHALWDSSQAGTYSCKGCNLEVFDARWKVVLDRGWLFFRHAQPNSLLTSVDLTVYASFRGSDAETMESTMPDATRVAGLSPEEQATLDEQVAIETHCRRCGSHFGHLLQPDGILLHCVNGRSFNYRSEAT